MVAVTPGGGGLLARGRVLPGWPYPAAAEDAGVGAVRPALTMSNEGNGGLAALPERLLNGGKKETNKLTSSLRSR